MFVDSHCHLHLIDYDKLGCSEADVVSAAKASQVEHLLCVCTHPSQQQELARIQKNYPNTSISMGVHPNESVDKEPDVATICDWAKMDGLVAIGETGLDYYRSEEQMDWQIKRFRDHITAAVQTGKALIIHSRDAKEDTLGILKEQGAEKVGGVMHCFTGDWDMAKRSMDLNFYISFSGIVTFKNAKELQDVAQQMPLDRMLIETDCPYLAPTPHRGKINQPAYVKHVAEFLAELKGVSLTKIAEQTTDNYFRCFSV